MAVKRIFNIFQGIKQTLYHPLTTDVGLLALSQYLGAGIGLITTIVAARLLGPTNYGIAALVMSYPNLLLSFFSVKSVSVTTRYVASFRATGQVEDLRSICKLGYSLDFLAALMAFVLIGGSSWWIARHVLNVPNLTWLIVAYAASFPLSSFTGTSWAILSSWGKFRLLAGLQMFEKVIILSLVVVFLITGLGVPGLVLGIAIAHIIMGIVMMLAATYVLRLEGINAWWTAHFARILPLRREIGAFFGWNYLLLTLSGLIAQIPLMLLGKFRGPEEAGYYRLATSLVTAASYLESSMRKVVYPVLSARWSMGKSLTDSLKRWTLRGGIPMGVILLLTIPFFPLLIPAVFGSSYSPTVLGIQMMMAAGAISTALFWLNPFYYAAGRVGLWTKVYSIYTVFILGLGWVCIQRWGFVGIAGVLTIGKITFTISMAVIVMLRSGRWKYSLPDSK